MAALKDSYPLYIANQARTPNRDLEVVDKYSGAVATRAALADDMPYGGAKDSGLGREGVRFAMEDMAEIRNLVIRTRPAGSAWPQPE